jgi:uncharacterized protein YbbC (DUF1343 family)
MGIDRLLTDQPELLRGRVALYSHLPATCANGCPSSQALHDVLGERLVAILSPEHGYYGQALAGDHVHSSTHPDWAIPIHSLYGEHRSPSAAMLAGIDTIVVDLQDLGIRCYTYVASLQLLLEAVAGSGQRVIVADRPIPAASSIDGPMLDSAFSSFVGMLPAPMLYGMTPGEAARFIVAQLDLDVELHVVPVDGYDRTWGSVQGAAPWVAPSPSIVSLESALTYPALVFSEAFPQFNHGQGTALPFQLLGGDAFEAAAVIEALPDLTPLGLTAHPLWYIPAGQTTPISGIRLLVTRPENYRPIEASLQLIAALQQIHGVEALWGAQASRPEFVDKLYGTDRVRVALMAGESPQQIAATWAPAYTAFADAREAALLYRTAPAIAPNKAGG